MNYKDNYSKNSEYMASNQAENPAGGGAPRRPCTNRRFDPTGMAGREAAGDGASAAPEAEYQAENVAGVQAERTVVRQRQAVPERPTRSAQRSSRRRTQAKKSARTARASAAAKRAGASKAVKPLRVVLAAVSGLICSLIVLLTCAGQYGMWCYSQGLPGDMNVKASVAMYCLAAMCGGLWAGAVVRRRSLVPPVVIALVFMVLSVVVSLQLFEAGAIKPGLICIKVILTAAAVFGGFWLSVLPYLLRRKRC